MSQSTTVRDLIDQLAAMPPDATVLLPQNAEDADGAAAALHSLRYGTYKPDQYCTCHPAVLLAARYQ